MATMDALPAEVLRMICTHLSFRDAAALRYLNRDLALIASEFLVTRVRFHTSRQSLQRLKRISEHPVFSRTVRVLVYEAALLADVGYHDDYTRHFELDHHGMERPKEPSEDCTDRERRLYERNKMKWDRDIYSKYTIYRSLFSSQRMLLTDNKLAEVLSECVSRFSKLTTIDIDPVRRCSHMTSRRFMDEFGSNCASPLSGNFSRMSEQLRCMLLPNDTVLKSLRKIEINSLSPSFFNAGRASLLQEAFQHLTDIDITMKLADGDLQLGEAAKDSFRRHLSVGVFRNALSSATNLEHVSIGIESLFPCFIDTSMLFSSTSWPHLKTISLNTVASTQKEIMGILKRQPSLVSLTLALVNLTEGCWPAVLTQMRNELKLKNFSPIGFLEDSQELWPMDLLNVPIYLDNFEEFDLGAAINLYVTDSVSMGGVDEHDDEDDFAHPLLKSYADFEDADLVRDMYGSLSEMDDMDESFDTSSDVSMPDLEDSDIDIDLMDV